MCSLHAFLSLALGYRLRTNVQVISMPQVNLQNVSPNPACAIGAAYCMPTKLKVKRAIRIDSVEPLMDGVPAHDAA